MRTSIKIAAGVTINLLFLWLVASSLGTHNHFYKEGKLVNIQQCEDDKDTETGCLHDSNNHECDGKFNSINW